MLTNKVTAEEINEQAIPLQHNIGKTAVYFRCNPFDFKTKIHKRQHWLEQVRIIGIGKEHPNTYLVEIDGKTKEIHASKIIRIQTQTTLFD